MDNQRRRVGSPPFFILGGVMKIRLELDGILGAGPRRRGGLGGRTVPPVDVFAYPLLPPAKVWSPAYLGSFATPNFLTFKPPWACAYEKDAEDVFCDDFGVQTHPVGVVAAITYAEASASAHYRDTPICKGTKDIVALAERVDMQVKGNRLNPSHVLVTAVELVPCTTLNNYDGCVFVEHSKQNCQAAFALFRRVVLLVNLVPEWLRGYNWDVNDSEPVATQAFAMVGYDWDGVWLCGFGSLYRLSWRAFADEKYNAGVYAIVAPDSYTEDVKRCINVDKLRQVLGVRSV